MNRKQNLVEVALLKQAEIAGERERVRVEAIARFLDEGGVVTKATARLMRARLRRDRLESAHSTAHGWWREVLRYQLRLAKENVTAMESKAKALAVERLRVIAESAGKIAVEKAAGHFDYLPENEEVGRRKLLEAASTYEDVWLYVFGPSSLLAGRPSIISRVV